MRVLQHGFAATTPSVGLEPGKWGDVKLHGQFLIDLEFLLRYGPRSGTASCVMCKSPPYLLELAHQFPWIHFYVFEHTAKPDEYDPANPEMVCSTPSTVQVHAGTPASVERPIKPVFCPQVEFNRTTSGMQFTKEMARTMGERSGRERESLLMICHDQDPIRQLVLHALMRPSHSLLDLNGTIPVDYLDGEIILPLFLPNNKIFACLVASQHAKCKTYDPELYLGEMGASMRLRAPSLHTDPRPRLLSGHHAGLGGLRRVQQGHDRGGVRAQHPCLPRMLSRHPQDGAPGHDRPPMGVESLVDVRLAVAPHDRRQELPVLHGEAGDAVRGALVIKENPRLRRPAV